MKIGDRCFVHGYVDEIRNDTIIVRNSGGYFGTAPKEVITVYDTVHPNWIFTKNRLPDKNLDVILYHIKYGVVVGFRTPNMKWYISGSEGAWGAKDMDTIIAWMPLPEPPEGYGEYDERY